jgi:hypothetical protein
MFRETDEAVAEPQFINLSYIQAQHDYLAGNYPVVRDDAAQMAALQMQVKGGTGPLGAGGAGFGGAVAWGRWGGRGVVGR